MKTLVLIFLASCFSLAKADSTSFSLGDASIVVPAPEGYFRCDGKIRDVDVIVLAHIPPTNRELAFYCDADDLAKLSAGHDPSFPRFFDVQVRVSLKNKDYSDREFNAIKEALKKLVGDDQLGELSTQTAEAVSQKLAKIRENAGNLKFGDAAQLGVFDETPDSICMALVLKTTYGAANGTSDNLVRVMATALVHVHQRIFYLHSCSLFQDDADITWTRSEIRKWRDAVISANQSNAVAEASARVATDNEEAAGYRLKAKGGDVEAARELGLLYLSGKGVPQDFKEALHWLGVAGDHGDGMAASALGNMYYQGQGVTQDFGQAFRWFQKAAQKGNLGAEMVLGGMYYKGQGVAKDFRQAFAWYQKVAGQGVPSAQAVLGSMYYNGQGAPQDYAEARRWFEKAANQGDADAQYAVGLIFEKGQGANQDTTIAVEWYKKAAAQGQADAQGALKRLGYAQ